MSNVSSSQAETPASDPIVWNPWLGAAGAVLIFLAAQIVASLALSLYPLIGGWSSARAQDWLNNSLDAKLAYLALANVLIFAVLYVFLRRYKRGFAALGLRRPKWSDPLFSLAALPLYVLLFAVATAVITHFAPGVDINQSQDLGFNGSYGGAQLVLIALALVVLPPITEEVIFRGLLYGSLKKGLSVLPAAIITSLLFAAGHLPEGHGGPLYIAAIDTFTLSLILVYLREKTGGLWASIGLHAIKNGIAFAALFLVHAR